MTRQQVRSFDNWAINTLGIDGAVLMENAGRSCAELIREKLTSIDGTCVGIFCGTGNNGGDGYVIARHLANAGIDARIAICGDRSAITGVARANLDVVERMALPIERIDITRVRLEDPISVFSNSCDLLVDALYGTGLKGPLRDDSTKLIEAINELNLPVVAVDIPSGLDCDTGLAIPVAIKAIATVTFVAVKQGFKILPGSTEYTGDVFVASIGISPSFAK